MSTQARGQAARSDCSGGGGSGSGELSQGSHPRWQERQYPLGRSDLEADCAAMPVTEKDLADDAPWKRIQQNTFTRWCNEHLRCVNKRIGNLQFDLSDGLRLIALLEVLSQKRMYRKYHQRPTFRQMQLENVSVALEFLEKENIKLVSIGELGALTALFRAGQRAEAGTGWRCVCVCGYGCVCVSLAPRRVWHLA